MKRFMAVGLLLLSAALLGGCYYDPGYSYVRGGGSHGDAYYGRGSVRYDDVYGAPGYDDYAPVYYGGYGGYSGYGGYGCCYGSGLVVGVRSGWRGGPHYRDDDRHDRHDRHDRDHDHDHDHDHGWYGDDRGERRDVHGDRRRGGAVDRERSDYPRGRPASRQRTDVPSVSRGDARDHERRRRADGPHRH